VSHGRLDLVQVIHFHEVTWDSSSAGDYLDGDSVHQVKIVLNESLSELFVLVRVILRALLLVFLLALLPSAFGHGTFSVDIANELHVLGEGTVFPRFLHCLHLGTRQAPERKLVLQVSVQPGSQTPLVTLLDHSRVVVEPNCLGELKR